MKTEETDMMGATHLEDAIIWIRVARKHLLAKDYKAFLLCINISKSHIYSYTKQGKIKVFQAARLLRVIKKLEEQYRRIDSAKME